MNMSPRIKAVYKVELPCDDGSIMSWTVSSLDEALAKVESLKEDER